MAAFKRPLDWGKKLVFILNGAYLAEKQLPLLCPQMVNGTKIKK